jgi:hypothetical protein
VLKTGAPAPLPYIAMTYDTEDDPPAWQSVEDNDEAAAEGFDRQQLDADQDASYACWACGEEIVIPIDLTMGSRQDYEEDCPVCCRPNDIHVEIDPESGHVRCWNDAVG